MTDAEAISFVLCFWFIIVFRLIAVTTTGGISPVFFELLAKLISLEQSTVTSNLHQLTCSWSNQLLWRINLFVYDMKPTVNVRKKNANLESLTR